MKADEAAIQIEVAVDDQDRLHDLSIVVTADEELTSAEREVLLGRIDRYRDDIQRWR